MLHFNTINSTLKTTLYALMRENVFDSFRLVGGTALSLQLGHRVSVDIDLFSDAEYGTIDFEKIRHRIKNIFAYTEPFSNLPSALGESYIVGTNANNTVKLDIYYTDNFIQPPIIEDGIRIASIEEIIAMKVDVIQRGGRKKDFWDLHTLLPKYNIEKMLELHSQRYPYTHNRNLILKNFTDFNIAENDFDPVCLRGNYWIFIKEDITEASKELFIP